MAVSIDDILKKPFLERSRDDQQRIILKGKPRPLLLINDVEFGASFYDKELWITACDQRKTFYCWPCLLLVPDNESEWTTKGYNNLELLHDSMKEHRDTANHNDGILKLACFIRKFVSPLLRSDPNERSEASKYVGNNFFFRKRLLYFMSDLVARISYPPPDVEEIDRYILEKCAQAVNFLKQHEEECFLKVLDNFSQPQILTDYLSALSTMMKNAIKKEIQNSTYVSSIINEHLRDENEIIISIVFRYLKNEKVCERFVGFYCLSKYEDITDIISNILLDYGIKNKLISFSIDSAMSDMKQMEMVVSRISAICRAVFVPCYFHSFEKIIQRRLSEMNYVCHNFFSVTIAMKDFLYRTSSDVQRKFERFVKKHFDYRDKENDYFKFIIILKKHKKLFRSFFELITRNAYEWSGNDYSLAMGCEIVLKDPHTIALTEIFFFMSSIIVEINDILCSSAPEQAFRMCSKYKYNLDNMKRTSFNHIWDIICVELEEFQPEVILHDSAHKEGFRDEVQTIFNELISCVIKEIEVRIEPLEIYYDYFSVCSQEFKNLLPSREESFAFFPKEPIINSVALQEQVNELHKKHPDLVGKTDHDVYKFLISNEMLEGFEDLFFALQAILTAPCKPTPLESLSLQNKSERLDPKPILTKLETIDRWSKVYPAKKTFINKWSLLSIEKHFLDSLIASDEFCNEINALQKIETD